MANLNRVVIAGRLTRDAELKITPSGQAVCSFTIAVNRRYKSGDGYENEANFFDVVLWGKHGEALSKFLLKGKMVGVDGELRQERWTVDDHARSRVGIVAFGIQFFDHKENGFNRKENDFDTEF